MLENSKNGVMAKTQKKIQKKAGEQSPRGKDGDETKSMLREDVATNGPQGGN